MAQPKSIRGRLLTAQKISVAAGALTILLASGLGLALPVADAQSSVLVTIPNGAGVGPSAAPGYSPDTITVVLGVNNTVTWANSDPVYHSVYSSTVPTGASAFHSPNLGLGDNFSQTFTVAGTYNYYCSLHSWMTGIVVVKAVPVPEFPAAYLAAILFAAIAAAIVALPRLRPSPTALQTRARASRSSTTLIKDRRSIFSI